MNLRHFGCFLWCFPFVILTNLTVSGQIIITDTLSVPWEQVPGVPGRVNDFAYAAGKVFAATPTGLYQSYDEGENWHRHPAFNHEEITQIWNRGDTLYLQRYDLDNVVVATVYRNVELWRSVNAGLSFTKLKNIEANSQSGGGSSMNTTVSKFQTAGDLIYAKVVTEGLGIQLHIEYSFDLGLTWQNHFVGHVHLGASFPNSLHWVGDTLLGIDVYTLKKFPNPDLAFFSSNQLPEDLKAIYHFWDGDDFIGIHVYGPPKKVVRTNDFVTGSLEDFPYLHPNYFQKVGDKYFMSNNDGIFMSSVGYPFDFQLITTDSYRTPVGVKPRIISAKSTPVGIFLHLNSGYTLRSTDGGQTWERKDSGLSSPEKFDDDMNFGVHQNWILTNREPNNDLVSYYSDDGIHWEFLDAEVNNPPGFYGHQPVARFGNFWITTNGQRSYDNGNTWLTPGVGFTGFTYLFSKHDDKVFAWEEDEGYLISTDLGQNWTSVSDDLIKDKQQIYAWGDTIVSVGRGAAVSYDNGLTWDKKLTFGAYPAQVSMSEDVIRILVTGGQTLHTSKDRGQTWTTSTISMEYFQDAYLLDKYWCVVENGHRLFVSANEGQTWMEISDVPKHALGLIDFFVYSNNGFIPASQIIFPFTDNGFIYFLSRADGLWRIPVGFLDEKWTGTLAQYGAFEGRVFKDLNHNCQFDPSEDKAMPFKLIQIGDFFTQTNADGEYRFPLPSGNYDISTLPVLYHPSCGNLVIPNVHLDSSGMQNLDFTFQPIPDIYDLKVTLTPTTNIRPGFENPYQIKVENVGTEAVTGASLAFDFNETDQTVLYYTPGGTLGNGEINFPINLQPDEFVNFYVKLELAATVPLGANQILSVDVPVPNDVTPDNNMVVLNRTVTGSFDPNDKQVFAESSQSPASPNELDYLIRFQNTGTDTAFKVVVLDTLDSRLDLMTFQMTDASHSYDLNIRQPNILEWTFDNILLPDSTTNEPESHGFLRFSIHTKDSLPVGSEIGNRVGIYFDYNKPVITNTAVHEIPRFWKNYEFDVTLCEGDIYNGIPRFLDETVIDTFSSEFYDSISTAHLLVNPVFEISDSLSLPKGTLFNGIPIFSDTVFIENLSTVEGCDSTITTQISVFTGTDDFLKESLNFKLYPNPTHDQFFVEMNLPKPLPIHMKILDLLGRELTTVSENKIFESGKHRFEISLNERPEGVYLLHFKVGDSQFFEPVLKF